MSEQIPQTRKRQTKPKNKALEFIKYVSKKWKEVYVFLALSAGLIAVMTKQIDWPTFGGFLAAAGGLYATLKSDPK